MSCAANELVTAGLIEDWALGGALAAIYYLNSNHCWIWSISSAAFCRAKLHLIH